MARAREGTITVYLWNVKVSKLHSLGCATRAASASQPLPDIDLQFRIRMSVPPIPVSLLIPLFQLAEFDISSVIVPLIDSIRLIFVIVPLVVVIIFLIVVSRAGLMILTILAILSLNRIRYHRKPRNKCRPGQSNIEIPFHILYLPITL
jgi:hypothetical protein